MEKKILLIMPNFFDYPQEISNELKRMGYEVDCFDDRPSTNGFVKAIIRVKKELIGHYIECYFKKIMETAQNKKYDIVFLISGQSLSFSKNMIMQLKDAQPYARYILYQWDSLKNFPYIKEIEPLFDECYSFDKDDVEQNPNLSFLPLFYTRRYEQIAIKKQREYKYDFCFVGTAHPKKYKFIQMMSKQLKDVYPKQFIYYYFPSVIVFLYRKIMNPELKNAHFNDFHFEPLSGLKMDEVYRDSRCVLDSAQEGQLGLTIRVIEALGAKKKLITTNEDVVNYDFYREENVYIYNGDFDYDAKFFKSPYIDIEPQVYEKYSLKSWLTKIIVWGDYNASN